MAEFARTLEGYHWIGMLPATIIYVYLGTATKSLQAALSGEGRRAPGEEVMFALDRWPPRP